MYIYICTYDCVCIVYLQKIAETTPTTNLLKHSAERRPLGNCAGELWFIEHSHSHGTSIEVESWKLDTLYIYDMCVLFVFCICSCLCVIYYSYIYIYDLLVMSSFVSIEFAEQFMANRHAFLVYQMWAWVKTGVTTNPQHWSVLVQNHLFRRGSEFWPLPSIQWVYTHKPRMMTCFFS